jgi:hypothetical protein
MTWNEPKSTARGVERAVAVAMAWCLMFHGVSGAGRGVKAMKEMGIEPGIEITDGNHVQDHQDGGVAVEMVGVKGMVENIEVWFVNNFMVYTVFLRRLYNLGCVVHYGSPVDCCSQHRFDTYLALLHHFD